MSGGWLAAVLNLLGMGGSAPVTLRPAASVFLVGRDTSAAALVGRDTATTPLVGR